MSAHRSIVLILAAVFAASACASSDRTAARAPAGPDFSDMESTAVEPQEFAASDGEQAISPDDQLFFAFDSDELDEDGRILLSQVAAWVRADSSREVVVQGHTDSAGDDDYNLELSSRRARRAAEELRRLGVPAERVVIVAVGEENAAIVPTQGNRRVVVFASTVTGSRQSAR